jgi:acyl-CoA reductase-like NAD-dependent aldehyde dehydrogenase
MPHRRHAHPASAKGTPGSLPPAELAPRSGEPVLLKRFYSAFEDPGLDAALRASGVDTLVVAGLYEHGCVRATVLDAYARGYAVWVAADAVGSDDPGHAEVTRAWLGNRAATYLPVGDLLGRLDGAAAARVARPEGWADRLERRADELVTLMADEIGKPVTDGRAEVQRAVALVRTAGRGGATLRISGDVVARRRPVGRIALITPFNNPVGIPAGKIAPALAFGNTVVWKPAPEAPATSALLLETLPDSAGSVEMVAGGEETARRIVLDPEVAAVSLTGSIETGRAVAALCARAGKPLQAELGGNNAAIVMGDPDADALAPDLALAAFSYAGQRCTALRRILVEESFRAEFEEALVAATEALRVGDPHDPATQVGPLISHARQREVEAAVEEAVRSGATLLTGGRSSGELYLPTLLRCSDPAASIVQEETFGPVAVVMGFQDLEEALRLCNGVSHGLVAAFWGADEQLQRRFLDSAQAGILRVNRSGLEIHPEAPFGGWKASGIGPPEHGLWDAEFYTRPQAVYGAP